MNPTEEEDYEVMDPTEEEVSVVKKVEVNASRTALLKGEEQVFYAIVTGEHYPSQKVNWFCTGANNAKTYIGEDGVLHIGADETAETLTITAQSCTESVSLRKHDDPTLTMPESGFIRKKSGSVRQGVP